MAGAVISVVPLIGVVIIGSRHVIATIATGAPQGWPAHLPGVQEEVVQRAVAQRLAGRLDARWAT